MIISPRKGGGGSGSSYSPSSSGSKGSSGSSSSSSSSSGSSGYYPSGYYPSSSSSSGVYLSPATWGIIVGCLAGAGILILLALCLWGRSRRQRRAQAAQQELPPLGSEESSWNNASDRDAYYGKLWVEQHTTLSPGMTWPSQEEIGEIRKLNTGPDGQVNGMAWNFNPVLQGTLWKIAGCTEIGTYMDWVSVTRDAAMRPILIFAGPSDKSTSTTFPLYLKESVFDAEKVPNPPFYYYEVKVLDHAHTGVIAIGLATNPYPPFRLPGWHQHSIALHSDDGRIYVDDPYGGRPFVQPWGRPGDVIGVGVDLVSGGVFFTLNGQLLTSQESFWGISWGATDATVPEAIRLGLQSPIAMQREGQLIQQSIAGQNEMKKWYPCIGAEGNCTLEVNFAGPFYFIPANGVEMQLVARSDSMTDVEPEN